MVGIELDARRAAEPAVPIHVLFFQFGIDRVGPFAVARIVPAIGALPPDERPDLAGSDPFGGLVVLRVHGALGTDDVSLTAFFYGVVDLESFSQITGHGLLAVDV